MVADLSKDVTYSQDMANSLFESLKDFYKHVNDKVDGLHDKMSAEINRGINHNRDSLEHSIEERSDILSLLGTYLSYGTIIFFTLLSSRESFQNLSQRLREDFESFRSVIAETSADLETLIEEKKSATDEAIDSLANRLTNEMKNSNDSHDYIHQVMNKMVQKLGEEWKESQQKMKRKLNYLLKDESRSMLETDDALYYFYQNKQVIFDNCESSCRGIGGFVIQFEGEKTQSDLQVCEIIMIEQGLANNIDPSNIGHAEGPKLLFLELFLGGLEI